MAIKIQGLKPVARGDARILVLGTMPGKRSLESGHYYEHPRNAFWKIAAQVLGIDATADYSTRCSAICSAKVALWDVLMHCERESSLDVDIVAPVPNDFAAFFADHPTITRVYFNGTKAEKLYKCHVAGKLPVRALEYALLPSTSPAHTIPFAEKLAKWKAIAPQRD
jgi:hypoxanthine-DNA glycosylase